MEVEERPVGLEEYRKGNTLLHSIVHETKIKVLKTLFERPEYEWTITELSEESEVSYPTVQKFVSLLGDYGLIISRRKGTVKLIKINESSPFFYPLKELFKVDLKPIIRAAKDFAEHLKRKFEGITSVLLFGSVAKGTAGPGSDIDLLVLVSTEDEKRGLEVEIHDLASEQESKLRIAISPVVMSLEEFKRTKAFRDSVKKDHKVLEGEKPW